MAVQIPVNALGVLHAWSFSVSPFFLFPLVKNFRRISLKLVGLNTVLRFNVIFLFSHLSGTFLLPAQLFSWCFSLDLVVEFHPVARCLSPSLTRKS